MHIRRVCICTESPVSPAEAVQKHSRQVQRQNQRLVDVSLKPNTCADVWSAHGVWKSKGTYSHYNSPW